MLYLGIDLHPPQTTISLCDDPGDVVQGELFSKVVLLPKEKRRRILLVVTISFRQLAQRGLEGFAMGETTTFGRKLPGKNRDTRKMGFAIMFKLAPVPQKNCRGPDGKEPLGFLLQGRVFVDGIWLDTA